MSEEPKQVSEEQAERHAATDQKPNEDRRELLKKVGKFAAYTPPALLGVFQSGALIFPSGHKF